MVRIAITYFITTSSLIQRKVNYLFVQCYANVNLIVSMLWSDSIELLINDRYFDLKQLIIIYFKFLIAVYYANDLFQNLYQGDTVFQGMIDSIITPEYFNDPILSSVVDTLRG